MDDVEKKLIDTYRPLVNYTHNPDYCRELEAVKDKCREYASNWAWIVTGALVLAVIITQIMADAAEEWAKANRPKLRSTEEVFTPEEAMLILPVMRFRMVTTTTSWTRMVVRKGSNLKTYRYFGIFKNQPISHFLQMREVRDVGEMRVKQTRVRSNGIQW